MCALSQRMDALYRVRPEEGAVNGEFTGGDPLHGVLPTVISAEFLNNVQNELVNAVEGLGQTLDPLNQRQLLSAITRTAADIVVGPNGHFATLIEAAAAAKARTAIVVVSEQKITTPVKIDKEFVSISFRWGVPVVKDPAMHEDFIFDVSKEGFRLDGLHTEGFKSFVSFLQPPPRFAFIRNSTLKGGTTAATGGTPPFFDLSTVVMY